MNIIFLGIMPWSYQQLSDTVRLMIAHINMKHVRIIYISPHGETRSLSPAWKFLIDNGIEIWNPPFTKLPTRYSIHLVRAKAEAALLRLFIRSKLGDKWRDSTILYVTPTTLDQSFEYVKALKPTKLLFDILDDNLHFPAISARRKTAHIAKFNFIATRATVVTAVSNYLVQQTEAITGRTDIVYLQNGVDVKLFQHFSKEPDDIKKIPSPRITFVGAITSWIDLDLLIGISMAAPEKQLVLIGPINEGEINKEKLNMLKELKNVHFLGARKYEVIPQYLHASDVLILPRTTDPYSLACDPLKLYEYLATGKPIVSTNHPSINRFRQFVYTGENILEFNNLIEAALTRNPNLSQMQQQIAKDFSWEARVNALWELIGIPTKK